MNTRKKQVLFLSLLLLLLTVIGDSNIYSKNILDSSNDIVRYEHRLFRYIKKHLKHNFRDIDKINVFYCNYTGECNADSLINKSFLSKVEVCFDSFPRNKLLYGYTLLFPCDTIFLSYHHWGGRTNITWVEKIEKKSLKMPTDYFDYYAYIKRLKQVCKELNIKYCIDLGRNNIWSSYTILVDDKGNSYFFEMGINKEDYCPLIDKVDEILNHWSDLL